MTDRPPSGRPDATFALPRLSAGAIIQSVSGPGQVAYRVTALYYRFESDSSHDRFDAAAPQSGRLGDEFEYSLEGGALRAMPFREFRDRDAARDALDVHLRAWEQSAFLGTLRHRIRFRYERSDVEAVDAPPGAVYVFPETVRIVAGIPSGFAITRGNPAYPSPNPAYSRSDLTDRLTERLRRARDGKSDLPATAYYVLTAIEQEFGGSGRGSVKRINAAKALAVDRKVLAELGSLTSGGDPEKGRKAGGNPTPLTARELLWMDAVVARLVLRIGEHATGGTLAAITTVDFPTL